MQEQEPIKATVGDPIPAGKQKEKAVRIQTFLGDQQMAPGDLWFNPDDERDAEWIEHWKSEAVRAPHPLYRIVITEFVEVSRSEIKTETDNELDDYLGGN